MLRTCETEPAELSVQICPARRSLTERWLELRPETGDRLQIAEEYDGVDRADVATITCPGRTSLTPYQLALLSQAMDSRACTPRLRRLGQLSESAWSARQIGVDFTVRRWVDRSIGPRRSIDACEVSARADPDDARLILAALGSLLRGCDIDPHLRLGRLEQRAALALLGRGRHQ